MALAWLPLGSGLRIKLSPGGGLGRLRLPKKISFCSVLVAQPPKRNKKEALGRNPKVGF